MQLVSLFLLMLVVGSFTFGGGYAIVGVLQTYLVNRLHWLTLREFTSGLVIGQVTPGPLSTMVAFVGYKLHGLAGGIVATTGLLLPSFVASVAIARAFRQLQKYRRVRAAIQGVSLAVVALLLNALIALSVDALVDVGTVLIALATFVVTGIRKKDPLMPFAAAAVIGVLLYA